MYPDSLIVKVACYINWRSMCTASWY